MNEKKNSCSHSELLFFDFLCFTNLISFWLDSRHFSLFVFFFFSFSVFFPHHFTTLKSRRCIQVNFIDFISFFFHFFFSFGWNRFVNQTLHDYLMEHYYYMRKVQKIVQFGEEKKRDMRWKHTAKSCCTFDEFISNNLFFVLFCFYLNDCLICVRARVYAPQKKTVAYSLKLFASFYMYNVYRYWICPSKRLTANYQNRMESFRVSFN